MASDEREDDFPKRRRYKMILDPSYESSMLSKKREKAWNMTSQKKLEEIRAERLGEPSNSQPQLYKEVEELHMNEDLQDSFQEYFYSTDDETDDEMDYYEGVIPTGENHCQNIFGEAECRSTQSTENPSTSTEKTSLEEKPLPESHPPVFENGEEIMFEKSGMKIIDIVEMIVAFSVRFGSTNQRREWFVEMFKICAGSEFNNVKLSNYKLSQMCNPPPDKIVYHFYCDQCEKKEAILHSSFKKEVKGQKKKCTICKKDHNIVLSNPNYFLTVDLEYQLRLLLKNKEVANILLEKVTNERSETSDSIIRDVNDGKLHQCITKNDKKIFTYLISTDGAPLFHISKRGFWPLQIIFNFLPPRLRFKFVLLAGIMIVRHEPKPDLMNLFIKKFMKETQLLQLNGIIIKFPQHEEEITLKFAPICVVADSVARPILQNRLQHNGYYGCSYCYHKGQHVHKAGMKYPFLDKEAELRTHTTHMKDVADVKKLDCPSVRGVKGESAFSSNPYIDMVWGFPLEYVHNSILGVTEQIWTEWNKNYLTPSQRREIDEFILKIQPPHDLHRAPEKISTKSVWKVTHWKSWLLYYSLPIMFKFLPSNLLKHYALFVNSIYVMLKIEVAEEELSKCEEDLMIFVAHFQNLYGIEKMTFNVHILLHAVQSVRMTGPLWSTSAFPFEHNIYCLKDTINGPKSVEQQMSTKSISRLSYSVRTPNSNISNVANDYCKNIFNSKKVTKSAMTFGNVTFFGPHLKNKFQDELEFDRCILNNRIYSSTQYLRSKKFNDTIVLLKNRKIAQITGIKVISGVKCWFELRELILKPFFAGDVKIDHIWEVTKNIEHLPTSFAEIESKVVGLHFIENQYVCMIPNTVEAQ